MAIRTSNEGHMLLETILKLFRAKKISPISVVLQAYKGLYAQLYIQSMYRKYVHHFLTKVANNVCLSARIPPKKIGRCRSRPTPFFSLTFDYGFSRLSALHQKEVGRELSLLLQFAWRPNGTWAHWQKWTPTFLGGT